MGSISIRPMRFPDSFLDELRARLPVSEVVGKRVKLKKAGREWKGLSPFNQEKTPSFFVNDAKQMWFDFSSGKNGNIFSFVMETEGVSFAEAVERLAAMAGLAVPVMSEETEAREERRRSLYDVLELAAKYFEATLAGRAGARARGYLADRGIDAATQVEFRLGYAPAERFALKEHLGSLGVPVADMIEAGLLVAGEDVPVPYDRFRERVMFPIADLRGRVIGFGGRALDQNVPSKYLNSPETPLFHKGASLYNGARAREAAHRGERVIVVEGYTDVIAMVRMGFAATVAPLGTALTEEQLALLWRLADEPVLCFDGDAAGRRAAYRVADLALPRLQPGKSVLFAALPGGLDPDDLARAGGREAIEEVLAAAQPLAEVLWRREIETGLFNTPERRAGLEVRLAETVGTISDDAVRKYYRRDFEARLRRFFAPSDDVPAPRRDKGAQPFRRGRTVGRRMGEPQGGSEHLRTLGARLDHSSIVRGFRSAMPPREALILVTVLNHPWLLETYAEDLVELEFRHPDCDRLRRAILDAGAGHGTVTGELLTAAIERAGLTGLCKRVAATITHPSDWPARAEAAAEDVVRWWTHIVGLHRKVRTLNRELKEAERALAAEPSEDHLAWLRSVHDRLAALDGSEAEIDGFGAASGRAWRSL